MITIGWPNVRKKGNRFVFLFSDKNHCRLPSDLWGLFADSNDRFQDLICELFIDGFPVVPATNTDLIINIVN